MIQLYHFVPTFGEIRKVREILEFLPIAFIRFLVIDFNQVVDEVNRLADKLVAYLCDSQTIQECRACLGVAVILLSRDRRQI